MKVHVCFLNRRGSPASGAGTAAPRPALGERSRACEMAAGSPTFNAARESVGICRSGRGYEVTRHKAALLGERGRVPPVLALPRGCFQWCPVTGQGAMGTN